MIYDEYVGKFKTIEENLAETNETLQSYEKDWQHFIKAVKDNNLAEVKKHLAHWSDSEISIEGGHGAIALEQAAELGYNDMILYLHRKGAQLFVESKHGDLIKSITEANAAQKQNPPHPVHVVIRGNQVF